MSFNRCASVSLGVVLVSFLVSLIVMVIFFIMVREPWIMNMRFHIPEANVARFNLTLTGNNATTLSYSVGFNLTARNPKTHTTLRYLKAEATVLYKGREFGRVSLRTPFDQRPKHTVFIEACFEGVADDFHLSPHHLAEYNQETVEGIYQDFEVDIDMTVLVLYQWLGKMLVPFRPPIVKCPGLRCLWCSTLVVSNNS